MSPRARAALLLALGVGLLVNPFYCWPYHAEDAHELRASEVRLVSGAESTPIVDLPPETAAAVEAAVEVSDDPSEDDWPRYESREAVPVDGLYETGLGVVTVDGVEYRVTIESVDRSPPVLPESFRVPVGFAGALSLALGALTATRGRARPTTRESSVVVGVWAGVLLATVAYDGDPTGVALTTVTELAPFGIRLPPLAGALLGVVLPLLLPAVGIVVGVGVRRGRWLPPDVDPAKFVSLLAFVAVTLPFTLPGAAVGFLLGRPSRPTGEPTPAR
ncbi:hypothetical protein [Salinilacihabitans rarus]|uniref:hypothetical protein n=1 Tax=Salinilacihabitans rarus TaxID=2961596 RepID=UPI0020C91E34|nr:hypothetical protein [Salinilacihabitans rarus]